MAQDRESLESQEDVIADVLRDRYSDYYRQLQQTLASQTTATSSTALASIAPAVTPAPAPVVAPVTQTVSYANICPGETMNVTYGLSGLSDTLQNNAGVILLGGLAALAYFATRK